MFAIALIDERHCAVLRAVLLDVRFPVQQEVSHRIDRDAREVTAVTTPAGDLAHCFRWSSWVYWQNVTQ